MRGPWNDDEDFNVVSDLTTQHGVDDGKGRMSVKLSGQQKKAVEQMTMRLESNLEINPPMGVTLGRGDATNRPQQR